jgi:aryl-alcohol dehydrogenase-like predicted oxidoreductase
MTARLGLGLAALGRPGYVTLNHASDLGGRYEPSIMESHAHAVLDAAFDAGIHYIDAARSYGRAEDFLASWLQKRPGQTLAQSVNPTTTRLCRSDVPAPVHPGIDSPSA